MLMLANILRMRDKISTYVPLTPLAPDALFHAAHEPVAVLAGVPVLAAPGVLQAPQLPVAVPAGPVLEPSGVAQVPQLPVAVLEATGVLV